MTPALATAATPYWRETVANGTTKSGVFKLPADPHRDVCLLLFNNPAGGGGSAVFTLTERDGRTEHAFTVPLGPGCSDRVRVRGAVTIDVAAADGDVTAEYAVFDGAREGYPSSERVVDLPPGAAVPGPWTSLGYLPVGRHWLTVFSCHDIAIEWRFVSVGGVERTRWVTPIDSAPGNPIIHPPGHRLEARNPLGAGATFPGLAAWTS